MTSGRFQEGMDGRGEEGWRVGESIAQLLPWLAHPTNQGNKELTLNPRSLTGWL